MIFTIWALGSLTVAAMSKEDSVVGLWAGDDSLLRISATGDGLSMVIVALKDPLYLPDETVGEPGAFRLDDNNPDAGLRTRPLLGLDLLSDYAFDGRRWQGRIYDPKSGNIYASRMEREGPRLKMRGYIGVPMLGRTQYFERVDSCSTRVLAMIEASRVVTSDCDRAPLSHP